MTKVADMNIYVLNDDSKEREIIAKYGTYESR